MVLENIGLIGILALVGWPLVAIWLYRTRPLGQATILTILGGYLLLPAYASIKFKMIPEIDKSSVPTLAAFFMCWILAPRSIRFAKGFGITEFLLAVIFITPFITSILNPDPITFYNLIIPGIGPYDAGSIVMSRLVVLIPFFLGRQLLRSSDDNKDILRYLVAGGLIYSLPILLELRLSPVLNYWVYGSMVTAFNEEVRDGGFRPVVFLGHGLHLSFFVMAAAIAAAALWRSRPRLFRIPSSGVVAYLSLLLFLCKSGAVMVYAAVLMPLVRWAAPRTQMRVAMIFVAIAISYPILRTADLVPASAIVDIASRVSTERANSLNERFHNEYALLEHASPHFWFGWGRFGRSRVRTETGESAANPDGYWIIALGQYGFVGFLAIFGLLGYSVLRATTALKFAESGRDANLLAALTLIIAISTINLLPNSDIFPWTWLFLGALMGRAEALRENARQSIRVQRPALMNGQTS